MACVLTPLSGAESRRLRATLAREQRASTFHPTNKCGHGSEGKIKSNVKTPLSSPTTSPPSAASRVVSPRRAGWAQDLCSSRGGKQSWANRVVGPRQVSWTQFGTCEVAARAASRAGQSVHDAPTGPASPRSAASPEVS